MKLVFKTAILLLAVLRFHGSETIAADATHAPPGMTLVPAGEFTRGSLDGSPDEAPPHRLFLPAYYIDRQEVTHEDYAKFLRATKHPAPVDWPNGQMPAKLAKHPVVNVTYNDAAAYATWAGKRLPTEAEWEKAARGTNGAIFPWGDSPNVKSAAGEPGKERTWPVGSFTNDLSPYGALDMAGNVWEWTSTWYDRYPGSDAVELEFGTKYKVIRGGGAIDYYGEPTTRRCADRARSVPYGTYDGLGFRCAKSLDGSANEKTALVQIPKVSVPDWTTRTNAAAKSVTLHVTEPSRIARRAAPVTSGIPFPIGLLKTKTSVRLADGAGRDIPVQAIPTATWRDGSIKWLLLDFQTDIDAGETRQLTLHFGRPTAPPSNSIRAINNPGEIAVDAGPIRVSVQGTNSPADIDFDVNGDRQFGADERIARGITATMSLSSKTTNVTAHELELLPDSVELEDAGPLRAVLKQSGWLAAREEGTNQALMRYIMRLHLFAGVPKLKVQFTAMHVGRSNKMAYVNSYGLHLKNVSAGAPVRHAEVYQTNENRYVMMGSAGRSTGVRAPGWIAWSNSAVRISMGVRDFAQQFPISLHAGESGPSAILFDGRFSEPFDWDQGLAKTHELWFDFLPVNNAQAGDTRLLTEPETDLFAVADIDWYASSEVFGAIAPFNFDLFPDYETLTEASGDKFIKSMATGIRNWGDVYYGGPYKGKNSYMNLEYDVPHNFLIQFARTGQRKYLDAARRMAQHQSDIDINHFTKWQWKHSPRHTEIQAEFGHTFTRGLIENFLLTGNRRTLEGAFTLGDYFTKQIRNPRETGNERQIGWGLISLLPVYEISWDKKYLDAATATVDRLVAGQDARGKFDIRWDNRIAFFNGIAATGFIYYERATGDRRAAEAALRTIRRTKGFYPEYAGRTLEALAWAFEYTGDPEYLDLLKLTYETTMARQIAWNTMELGAPTIFTVHTLPFIEQAGLVSRPKKPLDLSSAQFASENGLFAHHIPCGTADLYLRAEPGKAFDLAIVRKGAWKTGATAALFDAAGKQVAKWELARMPSVWQREMLQVAPPPGGKAQVYRLALRSETIRNDRGGSFVTWDIATSHAVPAVLHVPDFSGLQFVTPYLFTVPTAGAEKIEMEFVGEGEGFKKAVLYDPEGNIAGATEAFVDLGDTGRYTYKLTATVPAGHRNGIWRLSLQDIALDKLSGLAPFFSTSAAAFFRPDR